MQLKSLTELLRDYDVVEVNDNDDGTSLIVIESMTDSDLIGGTLIVPNDKLKDYDLKKWVLGKGYQRDPN